MQAIQDKLAPPNTEDLKQRLLDASPVAFVHKNQKLSPVDTPPNTAPLIENDLDKQERLRGLLQSSETLRNMLDDRDTYQLPNDLTNQVDGLLSTLRLEEITWYALEDDRDALLDCMERHYAKDSWNDGIVQRLNRIIQRIGELQPVMQPKQIPPGEPGAKPPETDPQIGEDRVAETEAVSEDLNEVIQSDEAEAVVDEAGLELILHNIEAIRDSANDTTSDEKRFPRMRRAIKGLAYAVGGITSAVGGGVIVNLLTAPEAAITLANRLQPILDRIIALFM